MMRLLLGPDDEACCALFPSVMTLEYCGVGCRGLLGVGDPAVADVGCVGDGCTGDRAGTVCISGQDGTPEDLLAAGMDGGGRGVTLGAPSGVAMRC